ncbi:MAG: hypothetical protein M4579_006016 [Chaenotheca gracillima]|nr:MAG: hypothetical protein M4579_006016 [Chaenotheca gracillima]
MSSHDVIGLESNYVLRPMLLLAAVLFCLYWLSTSTDIKRIRGLPQIPGALPLVGHLLRLGDDHASACEKLWHQYKHSTFQICLGNTRVVVVNSFEDCRQMLIGNQSSVIDRPTLHTVGVIASTKGLTIGSSPWTDSTKRRRKAAGTTLGRARLSNYYDVIDLESYCVVRDLEKNSQLGTVEVSVKHLMQRYALNTTLTLCYGIRMDAVYDDMLSEILEVGHAISLLRGASENFQDYVPMMRYFPNNEKDRRSRTLCARRDQYLESLLRTAKEKIEQGIANDSVYAAVLKDEETPLSSDEISSVCLSLVSGGFETVPGTLISCIGSLSTQAGQGMQDEAYTDIKRYYSSSEDAWKASFEEEKVPYVNAIVKETLRYYTVTPMNLPRKTIKDVNWKGSIIPAKTMVLLNTQAANHDTSHFGPTAHNFDPKRWLDSDATVPIERESAGLQHFGFGGGSRACPGMVIANRLLYTAIVRLITSYRIVASEEFPPTTHYSDFNSTKSALVAIPKDFKVRLIPRDEGSLRMTLEQAKGRTEAEVGN